ncbi:MAG: outer membrane protein transport protein [Nitrospirae bacterium]|nr:outer membrane protein transport protein [Nitrospirota bacterium]
MKKVIFSVQYAVPVMLLFVLVLAGSAMGAGFALIEQSVSGLGNAFAGGSAGAEDASTIFFNPAGLTRLSGTQTVGGAHLVMPSAKFQNEGSTHALQGITGVPLRGDNGGEGGVNGVVPNLYFSTKVNNKLWLGLGINAPFGLSTDYDNNWVGRYHAITSEVMTLNINPSFALKVSDRLSVGAGFNAQYLKAKLSNAIDYGTLCFSLAGPSVCAPQGLMPQAADGTVELKGDSWGFGYNLGLLYEFSPATRMGIAYRSHVHHKVEGDADFSNTPAFIVGATRGWFTDTDVNASVDLPASASISLVHQINPQWEIMADVTWTQWSIFDELRFKFESGQPDGVTTEKWRDNYRYSGGITYKPGNWKFRAGIAYDTTPVRGAEYRTPRIPDGNRLWLAGGLGYKISDRIQVDLGYAHLFVDDPEIRKSVTTAEDTLRGGLRGTYDASVDIISAQLRFAF